MMRTGGFGAVYLYYRTGELAAIAEGQATDGWTLADNERLPANLTADQLTTRIHDRARNLPFLPA